MKRTESLERPLIDGHQEAERLADDHWIVPKGVPGTVGGVYDSLPSTACTTTNSVDGLNRQLTESQICQFGNHFRRAEHPRISFGPKGVNLFSPETASALERAADRIAFSITSAHRTIVWQYMLGRGGCGAAATPGRSFHQNGTAVDVPNPYDVMDAFLAAGMSWPNIPNDPWHFNGPGPDRRSDSVRTFQLLWNENNSADKIAVDGIWGPQTQARLRATPVGGFPTDLCHTNQPPPPPDTRDTIGHVDQITADGRVVGWSCDPDEPSASIDVEVYTSDGVQRTLIGTTTANIDSEAAVNDACGGGTAHRYSFQLSTDACGNTVHVLGINVVGDDVDTELTGSGVLAPCPDACVDAAL